MLALIHLARVAEVAVVKGILEIKRNLRDMNAPVAFRQYARFLKHRGETAQRIFAGCIPLKNLSDQHRVLAVPFDSLCARVVQIAERREAGVDTLSRLLSESARRIRTQLANVLIRHTELHRHHQHIVVREVRAIVRLNVTNDALLQEPLYLPAVYRIAREPVNLPANNSLRLALLYSRHHVAEYRTSRHLRRAFFYEYLNDVELFALSERLKLSELGFNRQHLLVFDIGAFAGVNKICVHKFNGRPGASNSSHLELSETAIKKGDLPSWMPLHYNVFKGVIPTVL